MSKLNNLYVHEALTEAHQNMSHAAALKLTMDTLHTYITKGPDEALAKVVGVIERQADRSELARRIA